MAENGRAVNGDFHVIRMDNLFHVVFRPDSDPEWFRIIATFYTYERAYSYCDVERVSVWTWTNSEGEVDAESYTGEEEMKGLRMPPIHLELPEGGMATRSGVAELVRGVYDGGEHVGPHPDEDFSEHPNEDEAPKDFHARQAEKAVADTPEQPTCIDCGAPRSPGSASRCRKCYQNKPLEEGDLTKNQEKVLEFFLAKANPLRLVSANYRQIADGAGIVKASASGVVESLERRGLIEIVERGKPGRECVFRLVPDKIMELGAPA
jgi:ribosomal protein L40E